MTSVGNNNVSSKYNVNNSSSNKSSCVARDSGIEIEIVIGIAIVIATITTGATTTTATGAQSNNSANGVIDRNGSVAKIYIRSVTACSNSNDV